jgi:hypothetical protein
LPVPARVIYDLAGDVDSEDLPAVIAALTAATEGKSRISVGDAEGVVRLARLRHEYGDHPEAALAAMAELDDRIRRWAAVRPDDARTSWEVQAIAALKDARPTTEEAAAAIVDKFHRADVADRYAPYGGLPDDVPESAFESLQLVPEDRRERVVQMLQGAPRPLTDDVIDEIVHMSSVDLDLDDLDKREAEETEAESAEAKAAAAKATAAEAAAAAEASSAKRQAAEAASRGSDVGADSKGERERLQVEIDDLRNQKRRLEIENTGLRSEVEELRAALTAEQCVDALIRLLRGRPEAERAEVMRALAEELGTTHHQAAA